MDSTRLLELIAQYKSDPESVYTTWFINGAERMKAFRSIRRGVTDTMESIGAGTFGNDFKGSPPDCTCHFYLVAPDQRRKEVMAQLARLAFRTDLADISLAFIPFDDLCEHCDALCKFGEDHTILQKIAHYHPG